MTRATAATHLRNRKYRRKTPTEEEGVVWRYSRTTHKLYSEFAGHGVTFRSFGETNPAVMGDSLSNDPFKDSKQEDITN